MDDNKILTSDNIDDHNKELYDGIDELCNILLKKVIKPQRKWKVYDLEEIEAKIPEEIEPMEPIIPPEGYKVTKNTKIKYLEDYRMFIMHVNRFISRVDAFAKAIDPKGSFTDFLKDGAAEQIDDITSFYEEGFELHNGDTPEVYMDFTCLFSFVNF